MGNSKGSFLRILFFLVGLLLDDLYPKLKQKIMHDVKSQHFKILAFSLDSIPICIWGRAERGEM